LQIEGCIVVADALYCQKETARAIVKAKADYILSVKGNQETLEKDIEDYVQDDSLRATMDTSKTLEKNRERIEKRTACVSHDIDWLHSKKEWAGLACTGTIHTQFTTNKGVTDEWHYFISSRKLTAGDLLKHARLEWGLEAMHWLLDVHFAEDKTRVWDMNVQKLLNIMRKIALNLAKSYKAKTQSRNSMSGILKRNLFDVLNLKAFLENLS